MTSAPDFVFSPQVKTRLIIAAVVVVILAVVGVELMVLKLNAAAAHPYLDGFATHRFPPDERGLAFLSACGELLIMTHNGHYIPAADSERLFGPPLRIVRTDNGALRYYQITALTGPGDTVVMTEEKGHIVGVSFEHPNP